MTAPTTEPRKADAKFRFLGFAAAIVIAVVCLYFAVKGVDIGAVGHAIRGARPGMLAAACAFATLALFLRAVRWRILLSGDADVPQATVFRATAVGYLGNTFLPARMGELMRTAAISWHTGLSNAYVLATALTERMLDAGVLVLISSISLVTLSDMPQWSVRAARVMGVASAIGLCGICLLPFAERFVLRATNKLPLPAKLLERLGGLISQFLTGMRVFHNPARSGKFLLLTAVVWGVDAIAALAVSESLGLGRPVQELLLLIAALGLGSALPSTPGYVGVYQFVAVSVLEPFGVAKEDALAFIFVFQAVISGCVLFWGLVSLWQLRAIKASQQPAPLQADARAR